VQCKADRVLRIYQGSSLILQAGLIGFVFPVRRQQAPTLGPSTLPNVDESWKSQSARRVDEKHG